MEQVWTSSGCSKEVSFRQTVLTIIECLFQRRAKTKLPGEIQKKVDEWKFSSGALVMCLVAYNDGQQVQSFQ
jgi:hypothetical protein